MIVPQVRRAAQLAGRRAMSEARVRKQWDWLKAEGGRFTLREDFLSSLALEQQQQHHHHRHQQQQYQHQQPHASLRYQPMRRLK